MTKQTRIRIGNFMKPMGVAHAHATIMRKLLRKEIEPPLASRLSQMFCNQRTLLESSDTEVRLGQIEERLNELLAKGDGRVVKFSKAGSLD